MADLLGAARRFDDRSFRFAVMYERKKYNQPKANYNERINGVEYKFANGRHLINTSV
jgi:hypothetical protein